MKILITIALAALLGALVVASGAQALTNEQAFQKARACLVTHGAKQVRAQTPYGGGWVEIARESASWFYEPHPMVGRWHPQVATVSVAFFSHRWTPARRAMVVACVKQSLGPSGRVTRVTED